MIEITSHPEISPGLGVGMDLMWNKEIGFNTYNGRDGISEKMYNFFNKYSQDFSHIFIAFQPKNLNRLVAEDYFEAYDTLFSTASITNKAFHHTMLNTATMEQYNKDEITRFTNTLIHRYNFKWVVEDIGIWSIRGKSLPYPLPPILTREGLQTCIKNVCEWKNRLAAPLSIEFPGFTEGSNFHIGHIDAYDFFNEVIESTGCIATIDVGHILSYQWINGRQKDLLSNLEKLPLERCFELHLSGSVIKDGKFRDMHHGILLDEQIDLLGYFLDNCKNLRAVTYEDPKYDRSGELIIKSVPNYKRLKDQVTLWSSNGKK